MEALPNKISIEQVETGYIISYKEELEDNWVKEFKEVVEKEDGAEEIKGVLYRVADFFGFGYDKFAENNLKITFDEKGSKFAEMIED